LIRACFKENSSLHILRAKDGVHAKFLNELPSFTQNFLLSSQISQWPSFITAQTAFHHCTFQFITVHFVHHYTLKQAL